MAQQHTNTLPSGSSNHLKNIAIVGASGTSGKHIVKSLLASGKHTVTALTRDSSTAAMPPGITVHKVNYSDPSTLVSALQNQDAIIITMGVRAPPDQQTKLIHAAAEAGVKWILPNEFGYDTANEPLCEDIMPGAQKKGYYELIEKLGVSKWIGFVCGFWYEFSLGGSPDRFGFDFRKRDVVLFDEGEQPISVTTFSMVGKGVAGLLSLPVKKEGEGASLEDFANRHCYVASFVVSQKDMLESVLRVTKTGIEDWTVTKEKTKERYEKGIARMRSGDYSGLVLGMYSRNFFPDGSGNHSVTRGLDDEKLGLEKEDLDEFTEIAIKQALDGVSDSYR